VIDKTERGGKQWMITLIQKADEKNAYLQENILGWRVWQIFAVIAAVGILLIALGGFIVWSEYTFQKEKVSGLAIVLDKTTTPTRIGRYSVGTSYQLRCQLISQATNPPSWLNDQQNHWRSIRRGDQVQIFYPKSHPAEMRLLNQSDSWPIAGLLYVGFGLLLGVCGGIPLAVPVSLWLRRCLGIVDVSP
jgi:Protein of unknown function (DUF3592)